MRYVASSAGQVVALLAERGLTIAVAESLTGGLVASALIDVPGASAVVNGGVIAYNTELKHNLLGVDAALLASNGAVDAEVVRQMASNVRDRLMVGGKPADVGLATTGVAGPDSQDGQPVGTVFLGIAIGAQVCAVRLSLSGSRADIRSATVREALTNLLEFLRK
jgi:nicotinamide-nucleotide amidase